MGRGIGRFAAVVLVAAGFTVLPGAAIGAARAATAAEDCKTGVKVAPEPPAPLTRLAPHRVWPLTRGAGIRVAVVDSGVSDRHSQLRGRVRDGLDLVAPGAGNVDEVGHGTFVAGIIAAGVQEGNPFYGMAPDAEIVPIRFTNSREITGGTPLVVRAIEHALDQRVPVHVINLSLTTDHTAQLESVIRKAVAQGVIVVAAAGNEGQKHRERTFPASYPGVIAVSAIDTNGKHVAESNAGPWVDLAAPGQNIVGPCNTADTLALGITGTSYAAAFVSGTAALLRAYYPDMPVAEITRRLVETADQPPGGFNEQVGYGVVNPYRAVTSVTAGASAPPDAAGDGRPPIADTAAGQEEGPLRWIAMTVAAAILLASVVAAISQLVVRNGRRRGWRPGLVVEPEPPAPRQPDPAVQ